MSMKSYRLPAPGESAPPSDSAPGLAHRVRVMKAVAPAGEYYYTGGSGTMGDPVMALGERELEQIGEYVRTHLEGWLQDTAAFQEVLRGAKTYERLIALEQELRHQRELMEARFAAIDQRFDAVDARFDDLIHLMDRRFEAVDARFAAVDKRFEAVDKRFEAVDARFAELIQLMDRRFESVDKRFDDLIHSMDKRFSGLQWLIGTVFVVLTSLMSIFQIV